MRSILAAASVLLCAQPAAAQTAQNWQNPKLDPTFRFAFNTPESDREAAEASSRQALAVWQFAIGTSPAFGDEYLPLWQFYAMAENCKTGVKLVEDGASEFGDRARGAAELAAVRTRFRTWAAAQPQQLSLYANVTLGAWQTDSNAIVVQYGDAALRPIPDLKPARAMENEPFWSNLSTNPLGVPMQYTHGNCPDGRDWKSLPMQLNLSLAFKTAAGGGFKMPATLPMSREAAQAFVAKYPARRVQYELQIVPLGTSGQFSSYPAPGSFSKPVVVKRLIVRDPGGGVLADMTF